MVALNINTGQGKACSDIIRGKSKGPKSKYGGTMEDRKTASELHKLSLFRMAARVDDVERETQEWVSQT